jgi:hypothetical protein
MHIDVDFVKIIFTRKGAVETTKQNEASWETPHMP